MKENFKLSIRNKLKLPYNDLENISAGFKYFIASDGTHIFSIENESERKVVMEERAIAIKIFNKIKKMGRNVTFAEIFKVLLEEHGFVNTAPNAKFLHKLFKNF